jgi:hypothetical protein
VTVLDPENGEEMARRLDYVATESLLVNGEQQKCYHFRVNGGVNPVDLWFDARHRLVRQDFVEQGYRTVVQLVSVR